MKRFLFIFFVLLNYFVYAQKDSLSEVYYNKLILYSDIGYYSCPFDVNINHLGTFNYRNNIKPFIGIGFNYKWASLRIGTLINYYLRGLENYGDTKIFKIGTEFSYKQFLVDLNYYKLNGYTLTTNPQFNLNENKIFANLNFKSSSLNTWFFFNKSFSHNSLKGVKQSVKKNNWSIYLKNTNALTNINNNTVILPDTVSKNLNSNSSNFTSVTAFEVGILSGAAVALRLNKNFQVGAMLGFGGVIVDRYIENLNYNRNYLGLSSRYDFHIYLGYNSNKYFLMNYIDLDKRNIEFTNFDINSRLISYRFVAGYRF